MITDKMVEAACAAYYPGSPFKHSHVEIRLMRAALEAADAAAWRPISEAPKDGTRILVATKNAIHSAVHDRVDDVWRVLPRKITSIVPVPGTPTHFRPLPSPPKGTSHE
jgi:hypothetical protein